jgi:hypothetical protein
MLTPLSLQPTQVGATQDKPGQEKSFRCEGFACPRNTLIVTRDETLGSRFESTRRLSVSCFSAPLREEVADLDSLDAAASGGS